ncbi:MAG: RecX family transcriptional regulator, partial [Pseudomonadota bacterium]|nr:RecX family transcriptional regulator [Pseudomonadota bacterium]
IAKGIDHKIIEGKLLVDDEWLAIIHRVINKKVGDNKTITVKSRERSKLIRFLMMRGFKMDEISEAVSNLRC